MRAAMWKAKIASNGKKDIVGVEVGVDRGVHAWGMLYDWKEIKTLHLVDNYSERPLSSHGDARVTLEEFKDKVKWYLQASLEAVLLFDDNSLDFVYIDASHAYFDVLRDCIVWYKKVKPGGVLCGHDYRLDWHNMKEKSPTWMNAHGVVKAIDECVNMKNQEFEINKEDKKIVLETKTDGSSSDWWLIK